MLALASLAGRLPAGHAQPAEVRGRCAASAFFADGSSARPLVEGTVARGTLQDDEAFFTGKIGNDDGQRAARSRSTRRCWSAAQERYNIYCTPCHDRTGDGSGMVVQRGYRQPPSFHIERLRQVRAGLFFDVITNGFGAMPDYRSQIAPRDRWAIVAYIRALQLSQHADRCRRPRRRPDQARAGTPAGAGAPEHARPKRGTQHGDTR